MSIGTLVRIILAIIIVICPFVTVYLTGEKVFYILFAFYVFLFFLYYIQEECNCTDCWFSSYCEKSKKYKFVMSCMRFIGYDSSKLDQISFPKNNECENTYKGIYKYIASKYEGA